jgi:hypothetical protein
MYIADVKWFIGVSATDRANNISIEVWKYTIRMIGVGLITANANHRPATFLLVGQESGFAVGQFRRQWLNDVQCSKLDRRKPVRMARGHGMRGKSVDIELLLIFMLLNVKLPMPP